MGLFSAECEGCGHPLLCPRATTAINSWMQWGVAVTEGGSVLQCVYDGYGSLGEYEGAVGFENTAWHQACWVKAGCPTDYRGPSKGAADQGWFFEDGAHDMREPA